MTRMQKQISKRISRKQKLQNRRKSTKETWTFHGCRLDPLLYPLGVLVVLYQEHKSHKYKAMEWSESKAELMAKKYFGKVCSIDEDGSLWFCYDWGTNIWENHSNMFDKQWLRKFGRNLSSYIIDEFTIDGYEKEVTYDLWAHFIPLE